VCTNRFQFIDFGGYIRKNNYKLLFSNRGEKEKEGKAEKERKEKRKGGIVKRNLRNRSIW
jgi:hypothetical protein